MKLESLKYNGKDFSTRATLYFIVFSKSTVPNKFILLLLSNKLTLNFLLLPLPLALLHNTGAAILWLWLWRVYFTLAESTSEATDE